MLNRKGQLDSLCHFKTSCVSAFIETHNHNGEKNMYLDQVLIL